MSKRITLLELERGQLEVLVKEQSSQINSLVEKAIDLIKELRLKDVELQKLTASLTRRLMRSYEESEIISHVSDAWRVLNKANEAIVLDLGRLLATRNYEAALKLLDSVTRRHRAETFTSLHDLPPPSCSPHPSASTDI